MRLKPTEIRVVADLLEQPAEDAEELAGRIIAALNEARLETKFYYVLPSKHQEGHKVSFHWAYGPFPTAASAHKWINSVRLFDGKYVLVRTQPYALLPQPVKVGR